MWERVALVSAMHGLRQARPLPRTFIRVPWQKKDIAPKTSTPPRVLRDRLHAGRLIGDDWGVTVRNVASEPMYIRMHYGPRIISTGQDSNEEYESGVHLVPPFAVRTAVRPIEFLKAHHHPGAQLCYATNKEDLMGSWDEVLVRPTVKVVPVTRNDEVSINPLIEEVAHHHHRKRLHRSHSAPAILPSEKEAVATTKGGFLSMASDAVMATVRRALGEHIVKLADVTASVLPNAQRFIRDEKRNPEITRPAFVRHGHGLSEEEWSAKQERLVRAASALERFLSLPSGSVRPEDVPVIGFGGSGGGYRAMLASLGALMAIEEAGLLDLVTYAAGVSGSTWLLAQMYAHEGRIPSMKYLREQIVPRVSRSIISLKYDLTLSIAHHLAAKQAAMYSTSIVDIYGVALAAALLPEFASQWYYTKMSSWAEHVSGGHVPIPVFSCVSRLGNQTAWCEITPFEVGSAGFGAFVPTWAFGREFVDGFAERGAPEVSLGNIMGVTGSAFCLKLEDTGFDIDMDRANEYVQNSWMSPFLPADWSAAMLMRFRTELDNLRGRHVVNPPTFNNFAKGSGLSPWSLATQLPVSDAAHECNLPFDPLMRPERQLDMILMMDASHFIEGAYWLVKAEQQAQRKGLAFVDTTPARQSLLPFQLLRGPGAASVMYYTLIKDAGVPFDFRVDTHLQTSNFVFTPTQVYELTDLVRKNVTASIPSLRAELLRLYLDKKKKRRLFGW